jgi:hypothetical protein
MEKNGKKFKNMYVQEHRLKQGLMHKSFLTN